MTESKIQNALQEARKYTGIDRESLYLYALKLVFETHAATRQDWTAASRESQERWHRQMTALLNHLEFSVAGAESYAGFSENLSATVQALNQRLTEQQGATETLLRQKAGLENQLADTETVCAELQHDCREILRRIDNLKNESDRHRRETEQAAQTASALETENARSLQTLSELKDREEELSTETDTLHREVARRQQAIADRLEENRRLREAMNRQDADIQQLTDECHLLKELQQALAEYLRLEDILGSDRVHALANTDLIARFQERNGRLQELQQRIDTDLKETDELLAVEIGLNQQQWDTLRQHRK